jgi:hypothetical protein
VDIGRARKTGGGDGGYKAVVLTIMWPTHSLSARSQAKRMLSRIRTDGGVSGSEGWLE